MHIEDFEPFAMAATIESLDVSDRAKAILRRAVGDGHTETVTRLLLTVRCLPRAEDMIELLAALPAADEAVDPTGKLGNGRGQGEDVAPEGGVADRPENGPACRTPDEEEFVIDLALKHLLVRRYGLKLPVSTLRALRLGRHGSLAQ